MDVIAELKTDLKKLDVLKGFKQFILRGNVVDLAVGVVIGAAFNSVVNALVADLITPFIAAIFKQPNFATLTFTIRGSQFLYGSFLNALISFLISAFVIYFFVVLPINTLSGKLHPKGPPAAATTKKCPECTSDIPLGAKRCPFCTAVLSTDNKAAPSHPAAPSANQPAK